MGGALIAGAMPTLLAPLALIAVQSPAAPAPPVAIPVLTLEQSSALKCGVGFAMAEQIRGEDGRVSPPSPELRTRGREFFVRGAARIMDQTGASREEIAALVAAQSAELRANPEQIDAMMPACLLLLEASGI